MHTLFFRVYAVMAAALLVAAAAALLLVMGSYGRDVLTQVQEVWAVPATAVAQELVTGGDPLELNDRIDTLARRWGFPMAVVPTRELALDAEAQARFDAGRVAVERALAGPQGVIRLDAERALVMGPLTAVVGVPARALMILPVVVVVLALGVYLVVRPITMRLRRLGQAAERFGQGDLTARAGVGESGPIGDLARVFDQMAAQIGASVEAERQLFRAVSHELKTPLARMRFRLEMLENEPDPAVRSERIDALGRDVQELDALMQELLAFHRVDAAAGALETEIHDAGALASEAVDGLADLTEGKTISLDASGTAPVQADARLLVRAVRNLLTNAVRHARSRVVVRVENLGDHARIAIEDDGPGIPEADRERVFEPFVRLDPSRTRDTGGTGLGLAIVRRIAERHGGRAWAEAGPSGGARLVLELPAG